MKNGMRQSWPAIGSYKNAWLIGALMGMTFAGTCTAGDTALFNMLNKLGISGATKMSDVAVRVAEINDSINVNGLDFSPDGKHLATSSYAQSSQVHVWDWEANKVVLKLDREGASGLISEGIRYSPDGRFLVVGHGRGVKSDVIHVFDAQTGQLIKEINDPIRGGGCNAVGFTPDGALMIRITRRGPTPGDNLIAYSTKTWEPSWGIVTEPMNPNAMTISPDGRYVAVGGIDLGPGVPNQPKILIVDLQKHQVVKSIATFPVDNEIKRVAWSPDGTKVVAGAIVTNAVEGPDVVKIFDASNWRQINAEPIQPSAHIRALRYSPDGKYLAEAEINHKIRIWDGHHKTLLQEIPIEDYGLDLVFSRDSRFMAVANGSGKIQIWKMN